MPCDRTQHIAALSRSKSCSAYAANLIASTLKKNFLQTVTSGYKNCETRPVNFVRFFSLPGWYHFETPYSSYAARRTFDDTDILPIEFLCCGMQKPCPSCSTLTSTLFLPFAAWQGCIFLHSSVWHSVDAP